MLSFESRHDGLPLIKVNLFWDNASIVNRYETL